MSDFIDELARLLEKETGNQLGPRQRPMVENRIRGRLQSLGIKTLQEYAEYFQSHRSEELKFLKGLLTTHYTFFFREFHHFEFFRDRIIPHLLDHFKNEGKNQKLSIWSAACSTGQEPYSLAMWMDHYLSNVGSGIDFEIWGTDIDEYSVKFARDGLYSFEEVKSIPKIFQEKYIICVSEKDQTYQVHPKLKSKVRFETLNLFQSEEFLKYKKFHVIFCRNVLIYFSQQDTKKILQTLKTGLNVPGFLILGSSESIGPQSFGLKYEAPSVYSLPESEGLTKSSFQTDHHNRKIRALVVDDSPTIHKLMEKILKPSDGFQIVYQAKNGCEALEYLAKNKNQVDVITLDLQMPELDGVGFLKEWKSREIPIFIFSSLDSRDKAGLGGQALALGATDYIQKPTVENLEETGNEIRAKIKSILAKPSNIVKKPLKSLAPNKQQGLSQGFWKRDLGLASTGVTKKPGFSSRGDTPQKQIPILESKNSKFPSNGSTQFQLKRPSFSHQRRPNPNLGDKSSKSPTSPSKAPNAGVGVNFKSPSKKVGVLVVDDSPTIRKILRSILEADHRFHVIAETGNPLEVVSLISKHKPQLITLDIHMPEKDGVAVLKEYIDRFPIPTVMITSLSIHESHHVLNALELGAVDYFQKPSFGNLTTLKTELLERLFSASQARVRIKKQTATISRSKNQKIDLPSEGMIVMGASTGGTEALRQVLEGLPPQIPPILITQHIPPVFSKAFADRLAQILPYQVKEAVDGDLVLPNHVFVAPGGKQMGIKIQGTELRIVVNDDPPVNRHKPSVDYLFESVSLIMPHLPRVVGVILTGMGNDGARGLKKLRDLGAYTIGQDEATSVVYGMPKVAFEMKAVVEQLPLGSIAEGIMRGWSKLGQRSKAS